MQPWCLFVLEYEYFLFLKWRENLSEVSVSKCKVPLTSVKGCNRICKVILKNEILNPVWNLKCNPNRKNILMIFISKKLLTHPVKEMCKEYKFQSVA